MRVVAIPDLHCPFEHPRAFDFVRRIVADVRPDRVVCLGDEIDSYGLSRFAKNPDIDAPGRELARAREALRPFFKLLPRVSVCHSNHTQRGVKRAVEAGLPSDFVRPMSAILGAPKGWTWADDFDLDNVLYFHGDGFTGHAAARQAAIGHRRNCVIAHIHAHAGVTWIGSRSGAIFGMNCGCLINPAAPAFDYARYSVNRPVLGCGVVINGVPRFIPM